jgi:thiosulfate/3-mercaptopyruvate sulfurtransferase
MSHRLLEPADLLKQLSSSDLTIIDTRAPEEYAAGHIPEAISLPEVYDYLVTDTGAAGIEQFHEVLTEIFSRAGLTGEERVLFYENGTGMRCARGLWLLEYAGHPHASVLHGGLQGWVAAGSVLTREPAVRQRANFTLRPRRELLATAEDITARLGQPEFLVLDVRREDEYRGTFRQACCVRSGRVPGAVWLEWDRLLSHPQLRPPEEMRAELAAAGVDPNDEIIVYCHRGARSANTYLALKLLGYPRVRNYIGSWHEWSNRPDLPMER